MKHLKEIVISVICFFWLLFVATNVNIILGQTYVSFVLGGLALLIIGITVYDKRLQITFAKTEKGGWLNAMLWGAGGWAVLLVISSFVMKYVTPTQASISSIMRLLGASTPALAQSKVANLITFGFAIAYVETQLWARAMEFIADVFKINISSQNKWKIKVLILIGILAGAFVLFHLTAKGITNAPALWVVFIMMVISLIMTVHFQETRQAVFLHIFANTTAAYLLLFATVEKIIPALILPLI